MAQSSEKVVALAPMSYAQETCSQSDAIKLYNYVLNSLQGTQRFTVLDRIFGTNEIVNEKKLQTGMDFVDGKVVKQGKQKGADYLIVSYINDANAIEVVKSNSKGEERVGYEGNLSVFFRVLSVETGQVIASQVVTPVGLVNLSDLNYSQDTPAKKLLSGIAALSTSSYADSPQKALAISMQKIEPFIRQFIDQVFPLEMRIGLIEEAKDGKKTYNEFYIEGGNATGLRTNDKLTVVETRFREIGGKKIPDDVPIGKLKVIRVSEAIVACKVLEDEEQILSAYRDNKANVKVVFVKN